MAEIIPHISRSDGNRIILEIRDSQIEETVGNLCVPKLQSVPSVAIVMRVACAILFNFKDISLVSDEHPEGTYPLLKSQKSLKLCYHDVLKNIQSVFDSTHKTLLSVELKLQAIPEKIKYCLIAAAKGLASFDEHRQKLTEIGNNCFAMIDELERKFVAVIELIEQLQEAILVNQSAREQSADGDDEIRKMELEIALKKRETQSLVDARNEGLRQYRNAENLTEAAENHLASDMLHFLHYHMDVFNIEVERDSNVSYELISKRKKKNSDMTKANLAIKEEKVKLADLEILKEEKLLIELQSILRGLQQGKCSQSEAMRFLKESLPIMTEHCLYIQELKEFITGLRIVIESTNETFEDIRSMNGDGYSPIAVFKKLVILSSNCFVIRHVIKIYLKVSSDVLNPALSEASRALVGLTGMKPEALDSDVKAARKAAKAIITQDLKEMKNKVEKDIRLSILF